LSSAPDQGEFLSISVVAPEDDPFIVRLDQSVQQKVEWVWWDRLSSERENPDVVLAIGFGAFRAHDCVGSPQDDHQAVGGGRRELADHREMIGEIGFDGDLVAGFSKRFALMLELGAAPILIEWQLPIGQVGPADLGAVLQVEDSECVRSDRQDVTIPTVPIGSVQGDALDGVQFDPGSNLLSLRGNQRRSVFICVLFRATLTI